MLFISRNLPCCFNLLIKKQRQIQISVRNKKCYEESCSNHVNVNVLVPGHHASVYSPSDRSSRQHLAKLCTRVSEDVCVMMLVAGFIENPCFPRLGGSAPSLCDVTNNEGCDARVEGTDRMVWCFPWHQTSTFTQHKQNTYKHPVINSEDTHTQHIILFYCCTVIENITLNMI